jgi:UrcA family protein
MRNISALCTMLLTAGALAFAAAPASAQGGYTDTVNGPNENVEINGPHVGQSHGKLGEPLMLTSISQQVYFDDLNLRTGRGAHILKQRVRLTARMLCRELDERYPVTADDSPPCYSAALEDSMYQANRAIAEARAYSD